MAKVIFGPLVAEVRGRQGNLVFNRNRWGAYTRPFTAPANDPTPRRLELWARLGAAAAAWRDDLTAEQRLAWESYAGNINKLDVFGQHKRWTGRIAFISAFCYLDVLGLLYLSDPPANTNTLTILTATASLNTDTPTMPLSVTWPGDQAQPALIVFASPPMNDSRNGPAGTLQQIATISDAAAYPYDLWDEYTQVFDMPALGERVFFRVTPIDPTTGLAANPLRPYATDAGTEEKVRSKITTFTDAQIKAFPTTDLTIVPAVPGKIIVPLMLIIIVNAAAAVYTNISAGIANYVAIELPGTWSNRAVNSFMFGAAEQRYTTLIQKFGLDAIPPTSTSLFSNVDQTADNVGQNLTLGCTNALGNFTGGNAANSMKVITLYVLVDPI